jgi:NAD+ synthase (glutamine-hydrolysing)
MDRLVVAAATLNQTPLDWRGNLANMRAAIRRARALGAQVVCLPELCVTGYGCEDAFHSAGVLQTALTYAQEIAKESKGIVVAFGLPLSIQSSTYNVVALAAGGSICGFVAKQNLAGDGIHYEPRWFKPWPRGVVSAVDCGDTQVPVGDILFSVDGVTIGFEICEDAWVIDRPGQRLAHSGADIILNPSASHFSFGKHDIRKRLAVEGSRAFGVGYVYSNLLGCEAGRLIYDGDTVICSHGDVVATGSRFSFESFEVTTGEIDLERCRIIRRRQASFRPYLIDPVQTIQVPRVKLTRSKGRSKSAKTVSPLSSKHEEFTYAVTLGLFDYLRKSRSSGFVVSLSGGVDSSAASCLVALMVERGIQELGLNGFIKKLSYSSWLKGARSRAAIMKRMLACIYQGTKNSSKVTFIAAKKVAEELGAEFFHVDISDLVAKYQAMISQATGIKLSWEKHDLELQNIQARVRSPSVWLLANLRKALLLTTSNRSEAAVGYTTMDGDSSGGLSPLGGIDKAYLRVWLGWLEKDGPQGLSHYPSLKAVNAQAPTAELRPLKEKQTDEQDLMPYEVLDSIERYAIRDKLLPEDVETLLHEQYGARFSQGDLTLWVKRFFTLWSINQWKRERYAPSFHLDDESLDPKTWCRFPILSGGFAEELSRLGSKRGKKR